jgi:hypothetical protein
MMLPTIYESDEHALLAAVHAVRALVGYGCTPKEVIEAIQRFDLSRDPRNTGDGVDRAQRGIPGGLLQ